MTKFKLFLYTEYDKKHKKTIVDFNFFLSEITIPYARNLIEKYGYDILYFYNEHGKLKGSFNETSDNFVKMISEEFSDFFCIGSILKYYGDYSLLERFKDGRGESFHKEVLAARKEAKPPRGLKSDEKMDYIFLEGICNRLEWDNLRRRKISLLHDMDKYDKEALSYFYSDRNMDDLYPEEKSWWYDEFWPQYKKHRISLNCEKADKKYDATLQEKRLKTKVRKDAEGCKCCGAKIPYTPEERGWGVRMCEPCYRLYAKRNSKEYSRANREKINKKRRESIELRLKNNIKNRIRDCFSSILSDKSKSFRKWVGCTPSEFKTYIESKFLPDMNWDNYGSVWVIDHIAPVAMFNGENEEEMLVCWNYKNLAPKMTQDNSKKTDRLFDGTNGRRFKKLSLKEKIKYIPYMKRAIS